MTLDDLLAALRPDWHEDAACRGAGVAAFFADTAGARPTEARKVCAVCPVRAECLDYAMGDPSLHGVWGGLTKRERSELRARGKRATGPAPARRRPPRRRGVGPVPVRGRRAA